MAGEAVLIASTYGITDHEGGAILIDLVSKVVENESLKIDTKELREQGAELKRRMAQIMQSVQEQQQQGRGQHQGNTSVGEGAIMYG